MVTIDVTEEVAGLILTVLQDKRHQLSVEIADLDAAIALLEGAPDEDDGDDLPRPGKVWEGPSLAIEPAQRPSAGVPNSDTSAPPADPEVSSLAGYVRQVVATIPEPFGRREVTEVVAQRFRLVEAVYVCQVLKRMEADGQLEVVTRGRGRRQSIYRRTGSTAEQMPSATAADVPPPEPSGMGEALCREGDKLYERMHPAEPPVDRHEALSRYGRFAGDYDGGPLPINGTRHTAAEPKPDRGPRVIRAAKR